MKKIVVVSGSPRKKGNTMSMVKILEENMKGIDPSVEFNYLHLIDRDLRFCRGCAYCLRAGGAACPIKDGANEILKEMHSADGLIFTSPGYAHQVSGLFKNFIDRFMYLDHLPEFAGVPALIITTVGGDGIGAIPKYISNWAVSWWGCNVIEKIGIGHAFYIINEKYRKKTHKKLNRAANKFCTAIADKEPKPPTFFQYYLFMYNKTETLLSPKGMPARTEFWKSRGWFEADYYYDTKVNPLYKFICFLIMGSIKIGFKMMLGKNHEETLAEYAHKY